jgi:hypothetical protein
MQQDILLMYPHLDMFRVHTPIISGALDVGVAAYGFVYHDFWDGWWS